MIVQDIGYELWIQNITCFLSMSQRWYDFQMSLCMGIIETQLKYMET